jgi:hypothetical protein
MKQEEVNKITTCLSNLFIAPHRADQSLFSMPSPMQGTKRTHEKSVAAFLSLLQRQWSSTFKVLWSGLNAQSRQLDPLFPNQSRENASTFNAFVEERIQSSYEMTVLDFWELTRDAATSDGYRYLSDVNLYKAATIVQAADLLVLP